MSEQKIVDARGLSCPQPVLETKKALGAASGNEEVKILVDTVTSRENVLRFGTSKGWKGSWEEGASGGFTVLFVK